MTAMCVFCDQSRNGFIILIVNPETMSHPGLVGGYKKTGRLTSVLSRRARLLDRRGIGDEFRASVAETEHAAISSMFRWLHLPP